jgi:hypothetical protein
MAKWQQEAFAKNKGLLHRKLGVPEGQKIPVSLLHSEQSRLSKLAKGAKKLSAANLKLLHEIQAALHAGRS